jgi:hypothetical protein
VACCHVVCALSTTQTHVRRRYMAANARTPMATCNVGYEEKENFHAWLGPKLAQLSCLNRLLYVHPPSP